jgi:hypothetical protein
MDTDIKNHMLMTALASQIAATEGIHPVHAANRVRLAVEIAERLVDAPGETTRIRRLMEATRIDGTPVSDETKVLAWDLAHAAMS